MPILREYRCAVHGDFEAPRPICPKGCNTVERIFKTAPGLQGVSKGIDCVLQHLADSHGLTDMSNRNGSVGATAAAASLSKTEAYARFIKERFSNCWGSIPKGGTYVVGSGPQNEAAGAPAALVGMGAASADSLSQVRAALTPPIIRRIRDPQNLQLPPEMR